MFPQRTHTNETYRSNVSAVWKTSDVASVACLFPPYINGYSVLLHCERYEACAPVEEHTSKVSDLCSNVLFKCFTSDR